MNILDKFTSIDELLVSLLERIGGVTEEDTHFFSYPSDGTRATIVKGTTKLDFMAGTVMTPTGDVTDLGNSLRARGREYCRSLSLQADRDIIIQIGTKSKIPVFAGTWFKVAHLRFTDVKIIAAEDTRTFVIACTNPDSIEMAGESYAKDPVDVWGKLTTMGRGEATVRGHAPPLTFDRRGDVIRWADFESATPNYTLDTGGGGTCTRSNTVANHSDFSMALDLLGGGDDAGVDIATNDFHLGRMGGSTVLSSDETAFKLRVDIAYYDGGQAHYARMLYDCSISTLYYLDSTGAYTAINTPGYHNIKENFSTFKLVADFNKMEYVRVLAFGVEYDLSTLALREFADGTARHLKGGVSVDGIGVTGATVYVDNMVITENEPI